MLRIAFRTVGTVAPGIAARWAEAISKPGKPFSDPVEKLHIPTLARGMVAVRDPDVIRRAVAFLQEGLCR